jgi:hypothetical protein
MTQIMFGEECYEAQFLIVTNSPDTLAELRGSLIGIHLCRQLSDFTTNWFSWYPFMIGRFWMGIRFVAVTINREEIQCFQYI